MHRRVSLLAIVAFVFCAAALAAAMQTEPGSLGGTVKDPAGAVIAGAQVSLRNNATGETRTASTGDNGRFKFDNLAPGAYTISVTHAGFKSGDRKSVV